MPDNVIETQNSDGAGQRHVPVLLHEAIDLLNVRAGLTYVDATAGAGGHLRAILHEIEKQSGTSTHATTGGDVAKKLIGIDRDATSLNQLRQGLDDRVSLVHANYCDMRAVLASQGIHTVDGGILADLGASSMQFDDAERGFSFLQDGPLDMRMDRSSPITAAHLINTLSEAELADIIYQYGEDRLSRRIARSIVNARPIERTKQLADLVARCLGYHAGQKKRKKGSGNADLSHPATRTFQALRIAVNDELTSLEKFLREAVQILAPGARLVIITFHSLEDRLVKQILRHYAAGCVCPPKMPVCTCNHKPEMLIITRKPVIAGEKEVLANIRSRSAKLRAGEKL